MTNDTTGRTHPVRVKTFTKRDVAARVARLMSVRTTMAEKWVDQVFVALREIMMSAKPELRIEIRDFGVFQVKKAKSKPRARNPRTGETIFVPAHLKTHFKPSKLLKTFLQRPVETVELEEPVPPEPTGGNGREVMPKPNSGTT